MDSLIEKAIINFQMKDEKTEIEKDYPNLHQFYYNRFELKSRLSYQMENDANNGTEDLKNYLKKKEKIGIKKKIESCPIPIEYIQPLILIFGIVCIIVFKTLFVGIPLIIGAYICEFYIIIESETTKNEFNDEIKNKCEKLINGKPILRIILTSTLELEESKTEIIEFPIYDYRDISGKFNIKKNSVISFKNSLFVIDEDSLDYYKPLCALGYKFELLRYNLRERVEFDILFDDEQSYNNDSDFKRKYIYHATDWFGKFLIFRIFIYLFCLKGFYFIYYSFCVVNIVNIDIKKVISYSHKLNEDDLSKYNPEINYNDLNENPIIGKRPNVEKSEEEVKNQFKESFEKLRELYKEDSKIKEQPIGTDAFKLVNLEIKGMIVPMSYTTGYVPSFSTPKDEWDRRNKEELLIYVYGRKIKQIFGKTSKIVYLDSNNIDLFEDDIGEDIINKMKDYDNDDDNDNDDMNTNDDDNQKKKKKR